MNKKVKEYKSGDFIFAKVKGYPAWPARVQINNGKKYFVYFYGTAETANLTPNQIFDYAENKDKFLSKTYKRKIYNNSLRQIEHDFANNIPLEDVIGVPIEQGGKKWKVKSKPPATPKSKETRGRPKKEGSKDEDKKKEEEMACTSGRKIKPKRYLNEKAKEKLTLPSPAPKKCRRALCRQRKQ